VWRLKGRGYEGRPGTLDYKTVDFDRYAIRIEPKEPKKEAPPAKALDTLELMGDPTNHNIAGSAYRRVAPL